MSRLIYNVRSPGGWKRRPPRKSSPKRPTSKRKHFFRLPSLSFLFSGRLFRKLITFAVVGAIIGAALLTIYIAILSRNLPEPGRLIERAVPISTKIYDREGKILLYDIHGDIKRTPTSLDKISSFAKWAAIVAEDKNFYTHEGFRLKSIIRAMLANLTSFGKVQGGSTITQQFIKNAVLTNEKTVTRKLKELVLAYRIEKRFSKDEILSMYFNEIPYGSTIYGIEAAAQSFFKKSAADLDIAESALLAALPKSPTRLSPYGNHTDELVTRAQYIIRQMQENQYITAEAAEAALKIALLTKVKPREENILAPHFVLYVRELLVEKFGEEFVERGGLKVTTTLDWNLQQIGEEEIRKGAERNEKEYKGNNAALVAQDPKTGQILAMVGSRNYFEEKIDGNVNVALRARQPGSSFKPVVYAAAFEKGFTPDTPLWDVVTTFKTEPKDYTPHNYDGKEHGRLSMRQALAGSLNIPAVKTIYLTGIDRVLNLAQKLGYTTLQDRSRFGLSLVLGGGEVKLMEHVGAFATFANQGTKFSQSVILRIEDASGRVLEEWKSSSGTKALDPAVVSELTSVMSDNAARAYTFGANSPLILKDRPVAAKTGTTNDWRDGWTLGFTPSLAAGVWAGNNDNSAMKRGADGVLVAAPIWNAFMSRALKGRPTEQFTAPVSRPVSNPLLRGQGIGTVTVKVNKFNGKIANEYTPPELVEERTYVLLPHSELYYLNRNDLSAPTPSNPSADPNFVNWEAAVSRFMTEQKLYPDLPPTEYDTPAPTINSPLETPATSGFDAPLIP